MLELEQARLQTTYLDYVSSLAKLDLLAIDDFGLMDLDLDKCRDLFGGFVHNRGWTSPPEGPKCCS